MCILVPKCLGDFWDNYNYLYFLNHCYFTNHDLIIHCNNIRDNDQGGNMLTYKLKDS